VSQFLVRVIPDYQRPVVTLLWTGTVAVVFFWTLISALLCASAYAMSLQPPENPADAAPFPASAWFLVLVGAGLLSLALSPGPVVALLTGRAYLRRVLLTGRRWRAGWAAAAAAGLACEALLIRSVVVTFWFSSGSPRQPSWGPPALSAGFVASGAAMLAVMAIAARTAAARVPGTVGH
jgi:hypothetical protein